MASQYQVNIQIQSGVDFFQTYYLTNNDMSPLDITGLTFYGSMAKHTGAVNATTSTSTSKVYKAIPFQTAIVNGTNGQYSISLPASTTAKLEEGKYVYSVVLEDAAGDKTEILSGLVFVHPAMGYSTSVGTIDPNYP